jgi:hypothetical protein
MALKREMRTKPVAFIAVEGNNKTERLYLQNFNSQNSKYSVRFAPGNDTDCESMAENLLSFMNKRGFDHSCGDIAVCIIDIDANKQKADRAAAVARKYSKHHIEFVVSNPCFEVWLICHFANSTKHYSNSNAVIKELLGYIPGYTKSMDVYTLIEKATSTAIDNAILLDNYHIKQGRNNTDINANPRTDVHKLVKILKDLAG